MNRILTLFCSALLGSILLSACAHTKALYTYQPDDKELEKTIIQMDSTFFAAYNNCTVDLDKYAVFYADTLEFFHDKGGLSSSKADVVANTKRNICGKVTREVIRSSIEVYPIKDYGAIEMGLHKFYNKEEPGAVPHASKFIVIWHHVNNQWKITKVISLH